MSPQRKELEQWLKTIDVKGSVLDVGGISWPVKGRTKSWNAESYEILDIVSSRKGIKADYIEDLNKEIYIGKRYDNVFCLEVMQFLWNPLQALDNLRSFTDGKLYISFEWSYSEMQGYDCLRYTKRGAERMLQEAGFGIKNVRGEGVYMFTCV